MRPHRARQLEIAFPNTWGGRRAGAGRPPGPGRRNVPHRSRPAHDHRHPVHVTLRARAGLPPFREKAFHGEMRKGIADASRSPAVGRGFRVVHYSLQNDHVHLIVEAKDADHLSRGVQGLAIRLARAVNRVLRHRGKVWSARFHARALRTPREVRNGIVYVLMNAKKHVCARSGRRGSAPSAGAATGSCASTRPPPRCVCCMADAHSLDAFG